MTDCGGDTERAMSQENVELLRRAVKAFNDRDLDWLDDWITDDFEFVPYMATLIETTTYRGRDGLRRYQEDADAAWETIEARVDEIRDLGDRLVTFGEIRGRGRSSGLDVQVPLAWVVGLHEGKLRRVHSYADRSEALEAAGLSE
jgi:ketosteroid isomerase-like protein